MAETEIAPAPVAVDSHITHVRADRPVDIHFSFEQSQSRVGVAASVASHIVLAIVVVLVMRFTPSAETQPEAAPDLPKEIIWIAEAGPGGGGGGGGNKMPDPPKKAELPGKEKLSVPVEKRPAPTPKEEPPPQIDFNIPAKTMASAEQALMGTISTEAPVSPSLGTGSGGGAGTGTGTGIGSGRGSGLGPGEGGGTGGGVYHPGGLVSTPVPLREVKPQYTAEAMRAKVQGTVWLQCVVMPDGSVGDVKITKSLDSVFGLDGEAIKAARQWRFRPGTRQGEPVPVLVTIELTFTLR